MNPILFRAYSWLLRTFNYKVIEKSRLPWVDYLRGIAIILVVYRHVFSGIERSGIEVPNLMVTANMFFHSFRMPLFFILSGIFISRSLRKRELGEIIGIKFENLLYPYFIWAFLQISVQWALSGVTNANRSIEHYLYILYQPRDIDQFWYLPALFNTTIIYLLLKVKLKLSFPIQFLFGIGLYFLGPHLQEVSMVADWMNYYVFFVLGDAITGFFFRPSTQAVLKKPWFLLSLIPFFAALQWFYLQYDEYFFVNDALGKVYFLPIVLIGCLTMMALAFRFQEWNVLKFLRVLGFHSLQIYVMHVFVASFTRILLSKVGGIENPWILLMAGIAVSVTIPVMFYNLLIKDGPLWFLFSFRKRKPRGDVSPAPAGADVSVKA